jgi:glycosyltransferase involved in cell wall biosynthesis
MMVSIEMVTYNHEKYIAQAIEGVLMQETNFEFELIIADDCSPDRTSEIVNQYIKNHPNGYRIKYFRHPENFGINANSKFVRQQSDGKYIAICEGDDYWIDKNKLQFQFDFLESNPDFSVCFHSIYELINGKQVLLKTDYLKTDGVFTVEDLAREGNFIPTLSALFRNNFKDNFPEWTSTCPLGDYTQHLLNGQFGKYKGFEKPMAVYRIHEGGAYSNAHLDRKIEMLVNTLTILIEHLEPNLIEILKTHRDNVFEHLIRYHYLQKDFKKGLYYIKYATEINPNHAKKIAEEVLPVIIENIYNSNRYQIGNKIANLLKIIKLK